MKNTLLIPHKYKAIGWVVLAVFSLVGLFAMYGNLNPPYFIVMVGGNVETNLLTTIALIGVIAGLIMVCFSREMDEDEFILLVRLKSWQWAVLISYILLAITSLVVYGLDFLSVMLYNMFTIPMVFIIRFYWSLYRLKREG